MNIYINDPELIKRIKSEAKKMHRSVSYVIVEVLRHAFRKAHVGIRKVEASDDKAAATTTD